MKILYIIPYTPVNPTFGGALRIYHILRHLVKNHDVTVAGHCAPGEERRLVEEFPSLKGKTHFTTRDYSGFTRRMHLLRSLFSRHSHWHHMAHSHRFQMLLDHLLSAESFDVIQAEFPVMADYRMDSNAIRIMDAHNVEYDNFRRMAAVDSFLKRLYYRHESHKFYKEEIRICRRQDAIFATSERDIGLLDKDVHSVPKFLIPNGVDLENFRPSQTIPQPNTLVFVGMMKYVPNYDGMLFFIDEVLPRIRAFIPDTKIYIVGSKPPQSILRRAGRNVIVTGFVEDIRPFMEKAAVYVVPLRMGGGTRLKIIEALAMKRPVVTTSIGCEGLDIENRQTALVADDPQDFADRVVELLRNRDLRLRLASSGYQIAQAKYSWNRIEERMEEAYSLLLYNRSDDGSKTGSIRRNGIHRLHKIKQNGEI